MPARLDHLDAAERERGAVFPFETEALRVVFVLDLPFEPLPFFVLALAEIALPFALAAFARPLLDRLRWGFVVEPVSPPKTSLALSMIDVTALCGSGAGLIPCFFWKAVFAFSISVPSFSS